MRLIVYLLIAKGVLFAVTMMLPESEQDNVFGHAAPTAEAASLPSRG
jgi:hypothetical protein